MTFQASPMLSASILTHGPRARPWVALTFDADMTAGMQLRGGGGRNSSYDAAIVGVLRETRTPATFFVSGRWAQIHSQALRELAADALFQVENHSF
jgi:peptidoglycan-N-acetylglucosamine deacetylase